MKCELRFDYGKDKDGNLDMKILGDMNRKYYSKNPVQIGTKYDFVTNDYEYFGENEYFETHLRAVKTGSRFVRLADYSRTTKGRYKLSSSGEGTVGGQTSDSVYRCDVDVKSLTPESSDVRFIVIIADETKESYRYQNIISDSPVLRNDLTKSTITENVSDIVSRFVEFSSDKVSYNETSIPKSITFSAPFKDTSVTYNKYTKVTFNWDEGSSSYKIDKDSFINTYKADFAELYNSEN